MDIKENGYDARRRMLRSSHYKKIENICKIRKHEYQNTSHIERALKNYVLSGYKVLITKSRYLNIREETLEGFILDFPLFYIDMIFNNDIDEDEDGNFYIHEAGYNTNKEVKRISNSDFSIMSVLECVFEIEYVSDYLKANDWKKEEVMEKVRSNCISYAIKRGYISNNREVDDCLLALR